jgi:DNA-directed RNA polymerase specialized sigma24 family protein
MTTQVRNEVSLIERCISGDSLAWDQLYRQFSRPLWASIRLLMGPGSVDPNLVDEISARVWFSLAADGGKLLGQYSPERGKFTTYLATIARNEFRTYFRSERRSRNRERIASRHERAESEFSRTSLDNSIIEFVKKLTPAEQGFCLEVLLSAESNGSDTDGNGQDGKNGKTSYSPSNTWQLRHRIHRKLERFLREEFA